MGKGTWLSVLVGGVFSVEMMLAEDYCAGEGDGEDFGS